MGVVEHPGSEATHSSRPFLPTGSLIAPVGQPNSTLVAVSIFLLLTSLTYILFKLSPRLVTEGCACGCVRVCECVAVCCCVSVVSGVLRARPAPLPLCSPPPTRRQVLVGGGFQASALDQCSFQVTWSGGQCDTKELRRDPKSWEPSCLELSSSAFRGAGWFAHLLTHLMKTVSGIGGTQDPALGSSGCLREADAHRGPSETGHHTCQVMRRVQGLIKDRTQGHWPGVDT